MPDWAGLLKDVLDLIIDKFSAVCKTWHSMAWHHKEKRMRRMTNHQLPWQLRYSTRDGWCLYDFITSEIFNFQLRSVPRTACHGSCHGWLFFTVRGYSNHTTTLTISNPLSGDVLWLPAFDKSCFSDINGIALSRDPNLGSFQVLVTPRDAKVVAHLRIGDQGWTYSEPKGLYYFWNVVFYKERMLSVSLHGEIASLEESPECGIEVKKIGQVGFLNSRRKQPYFVETTDGDLLIVTRYGGDPNLGHTYKVHKLVDSNIDGQLEHVPVVNLGGQSLFLGKNQSISVLASDYPGCRPNSIYYSCYKSGTYDEHGFLWNFGIEEFDLNDQAARECRDLLSYYEIPWVVPSMNF